MAEVPREDLQVAMRELFDALDTLCSACKSQSVPRIIQAVHEGETVLAKTKETTHAHIS